MRTKKTKHENGRIVTAAALREWAKRMQLRPDEAAHALVLTRSGYNAKLYATRPIDQRTAVLAAYYEADPDLARRILRQ